MFKLTLESAGAETDWPAFAADLVTALAWPLSALVIALIFRRPLLALLARLDELSWGDKSARFAQRLDRLESEASPAPPEPDGPEIALTGDHARFLKLLDLSPGAAVLDSWAGVEEALQSLAIEHAVASGDASEAGRSLQKRGVLPARTICMIEEMRRLRNAAAHDMAISVSDALRFRNLAKGVLNEIRLA